MLGIRRLTSDDAETYRAVRLEGLRLHPEAFGASYETEVEQPLDFFANRLTNSTVFGAFEADTLLGVAGHFAPTSLKERHKATLFGMYVRDTARGRGVGQMLVEAVVADAAAQFESILLTVATANDGARRLYERCGFETYGIEPRSLKVDGVYYDEALMYRRLDG
ncbi:MAG: GNAT family N-acetyltransferase [Rhodospirillaceae bacterium]|nr:GNAT family N-acetyltransferase [Rhodospirillaceae bacterium]MDD9914131.1 GNAT family N-acetyltransferase [Rhodospirillaceae bacterium]MDD9925345.1 GNAT family N-acetyltransferase [Rhodospirillaceae bacterium]